jgi:Luciferase-like monooxygenase
VAVASLNGTKSRRVDATAGAPIEGRKMRGVKFGVGLFPIEPLRRMLTLIRLAEDAGFSCAYIGDSQMIWREPYVLLGAAAMATKRITLATGVTNPITRDLGVTPDAGHLARELRVTFNHELLSGTCRCPVNSKAGHYPLRAIVGTPSPPRAARRHRS